MVNQMKSVQAYSWNVICYCHTHSCMLRGITLLIHQLSKIKYRTLIACERGMRVVFDENQAGSFFLLRFFSLFFSPRNQWGKNVPLNLCCILNEGEVAKSLSDSQNSSAGGRQHPPRSLNNKNLFFNPLFFGGELRLPAWINGNL